MLFFVSLLNRKMSLISYLRIELKKKNVPKCVSCVLVIEGKEITSPVILNSTLRFWPVTDMDKLPGEKKYFYGGLTQQLTVRTSS